MDFIIRQSDKSDYNSIYNVVNKAFQLAEHSDGTEQELVIKLFDSKAFIPELSLVAVLDNNIVGHIMFTVVKLGSRKELALAPLSVLPQYQKKGIGKALIKAGHDIATKLGYEFIIVLGSEKYYPLSGYKKASDFAIYPPFEVHDENFMAINLNNCYIQVNQTVKYAPEFGI